MNALDKKLFLIYMEENQKVYRLPKVKSPKFLHKHIAMFCFISAIALLLKILAEFLVETYILK